MNPCCWVRSIILILPHEEDKANSTNFSNITSFDCTNISIASENTHERLSHASSHLLHAAFESRWQKYCPWGKQNMTIDMIFQHSTKRICCQILKCKPRFVTEFPLTLISLISPISHYNAKRACSVSQSTIGFHTPGGQKHISIHVLMMNWTIQV